MKNNLVIVIVGPTAVGKSKLAVELASIINGEIISADSMQIYKDMEIGTAKLTKDEMISNNGLFIKHHLIDIIDPKDNFSVADYQKLARATIKNIQKKGKKPILVGGTGLYINAVIYDYEFENLTVDINLRNKLQNEVKEYGSEYIYNKLVKIDPASANKIHPNNIKRIVRALEYYYKTGKLISDNDNKNKNYFNSYIIGLYCKRSLLYENINKRVDKMLQNGLVNEVKKLLYKNVDVKSTSMQGLGYKEIAEYIQGKLSYNDAVEVIKRDTRRYAKRQLTWFRKDNRVNWIEIGNNSNIVFLAKEIKKLLEG